MTTFHEHHLTPTHAGGSDTDDNKVRVPVVRHAMFHFARWQLYGDPYDRLAWKGLAGLSTREDCVAEAQRLGGIKLAEKRKKENPEWFIDFAAKGTQQAAKLWKENPEWAEKRRQQNKAVAPLGGKKSAGKHWFHNLELGKESSSFDSPGEGWKPGRLPGQKRRRKK